MKIYFYSFLFWLNKRRATMLSNRLVKLNRRSLKLYQKLLKLKTLRGFLQ